MIKAIIFDLFGTLTNGVANEETRIRQEFRVKASHQFFEEILCSTKFTTMDFYLGVLIEGLKLEDSEEMREKLQTIFTEELAKESLRPETKSVLTKLKERGYKLGIISNISCPKMDLLAREDMKGYFDCILYSYEEGIAKPDHRLFEKMLKRLEVDPNEALMVGNKPEADVEPAGEVGIKGLLIDSQKLYPKHPKRIESLEKIYDYL